MDDAIDIVARLRAAARTGDLPLGSSFDCDAVADEIERLQHRVTVLEQALNVAERMRYLIDEHGMADGVSACPDTMEGRPC